MFYVYILTNKRGNVLYTGVTNDLSRRIYEHKHGSIDGFTKKYNVNKLVYFETCEYAVDAIAREKQVKGWSRKKKDELITAFNPGWKDLYRDQEYFRYASDSK